MILNGNYIIFWKLLQVFLITKSVLFIIETYFQHKLENILSH